MAPGAATGYPCRLVTDEDMPLADPAADWWMMDDVATHLRLKPETVRRYRGRPVDHGGLPPEDRMFGRTPAWKPSTIITWSESGRLGRGARTDLSRGVED